MKRITAIIIAALLLVPFAACARGNEGENTPEPYQNTAEPAVTAAPTAEQTFVPDHSYNSETDFNNLFGGCKAYSFTETEDAYYFHMHSYLRYYDKASGESGVLCPKPECEHDAIANNSACSAYGDCRALACYEGRLYWFCEDRGRWRIMSVNTDGTDKRLVREIEITQELSGDCSAFFHRGRVYLVIIGMDVLNGTPGMTLRVCRVPIEKDGYEEILSIPCLGIPQATLRFIGDDVYIFGNHDGVDTGGRQLTDAELAELAGNSMNKLFVMRWNEGMTKPEFVWLNENYGFWANTKAFWVERDGTVYFGTQRLADPERQFDSEGNPARYYLCRIGPDGNAKEVFDMFDGEQYYGINAVSADVVIGTLPTSKREGKVGVWVRRFNGETIYKGTLPFEYRERITDDCPHSFSLGSDYFGTEDWIVLGLEEEYSDHPDGLKRYYYVKYDFTENGPAETLLGEESSVWAR